MKNERLAQICEKIADFKEDQISKGEISFGGCRIVARCEKEWGLSEQEASEFSAWISNEIDPCTFLVSYIRTRFKLALPIKEVDPLTVQWYRDQAKKLREQPELQK